MCKWHKSHLNGFTPVWICLSFLKCLHCANVFSHKSHLNGFTPGWIFVYSSSQIVKINSHINHILIVLLPYELNWVCFCVFKFPDHKNDLSYKSHLDNENDLSHKLHMNSFNAIRVVFVFSKLEILKMTFNTNHI